MERDSQTLAKKKHQFRQSFPFGPELLAQLAHDGAEVTWVDATQARGWHLHVQLPAALQERFGTAPEVLLVAVSGRVMARDLERARAHLYEAGFRLDLDLLLVSDGEPDLEQRLQRLPGRWGQWLPFGRGKAGWQPLTELLRSRLPTAALFDETNPVRGRQVIGRTEEIADLTWRIEQGKSLGVFGLRKVGKTSVVRAATDVLDPHSAWRSQLSLNDRATGGRRALVAWLDVERVYQRSRAQLLSRLASEVETCLRSWHLPIPSLPTDPLERIDLLLAKALPPLAMPLCIVLDEYDLLFEGSAGEPPIPGVRELFQLLRGWAQDTGRLSLVVIGRDPSFFQRPELEGFPNPMLGWCVPRWIGPMAEPAADELLTQLGRRVGLRMEPSTLSEAYQWTGGHPLMHRQFGAAIQQVVQPPREVDAEVPTGPLDAEAVRAFQQRQLVRDTCREVLQLLRTRYAAAARALEQLVAASPGGRGLPGPEQLQPLRDFGILKDAPIKPQLPRMLVQFLRENPGPSARRGRG